MNSLFQRCIAIVLFTSLLLQSCSEGRHAGTLRMAGSEGEEEMDTKPAAQPRGGQVNIAASATSSVVAMEQTINSDFSSDDISYTDTIARSLATFTIDGIEQSYNSNNSIFIQSDRLCNIGSSAPNQRVARAKIHMPLAPSPITFFVGREPLLKQLSEAYQNKTGRIVQLLTGLGGVGKTQLARSLYRTVQEKKEYPHTFWLSAESKETLTSNYLGIADMLDIYIDEQQIEKTIQKVRMHLAGEERPWFYASGNTPNKEQPCFYVFDNAPDQETIKGFLPLKYGHVLITSKNSAPDAWEHGTKRVSVPPFAKPEVMALAEKLGCPLDPRDEKTLHYFVKNMSGYPLTLAQFFSFCNKLDYNPAYYVQDLKRQPLLSQDEELLKLLRATPTGNIPYDESIVQVLRTSLEQLGKESHGTNAIELLSQLAYLDPKGIPADWLLTFLPEDRSRLNQEAREALALLEQYSLVQWDRERKQVYIHEVTQQVIRHLHPQESLTELVNRLINYIDPKEQVYQNRAAWSSLLPHGRALFARIDPTLFPAEGYLLTRYLAHACRVTSLFEEGASWAERCLSIAKARYPNQDHPDVAYAFQTLGASWVELGKHRKALEYKQQALEILNCLLLQHQNYRDDGDYLSSVDHAMSDVGSSLSQLGDYFAALQNQVKVLWVRKLRFGKQDHPEVAHSLNSIGELLSHLGDYKQALRYKQKGLDMRERLFPGRNHPDVGRSLASVGIGYEQVGRHDDALRCKEEALSLRQQLHENKNHPDVAHSLNNVGETLIKLGRFGDGLESCKKALAMRRAIYGSGAHHYVAYSLNSIGVALTGSGKLKEGLKHSKQALAMLRKVYPRRDHPYMVLALNNIAISSAKLDRVEDEIKYLAEVSAMQERLEQLGKAFAGYDIHSHLEQLDNALARVRHT